MAKDKKSFLIYCDLIHTVKKLSKENAGELFLHLLEYVNDLNPETDNPIVDIVFEPIKQQLKRDLRAYDKTLEDRSLNGRIGNLKRWNNDLYLRFENKEITIEEAENIANYRKASPPDSTLSPPIAKVAVTDNVNVTDNVIINYKEVNSIDSRKLKFAHTLKPFIDLYGKETIRNFYEYWTEPDKSNKKFRQEMQKTWSAERRLRTWNENNFNKNNNGKSTITDTNEFKQVITAIKSDGVRR